MRHTAQIGPFPIVIRLPSPGEEDAARPSAAQAFLTYVTLRGPRHLGGFPVLVETQQAVHEELQRLTSRPIAARSGGEAVALLFEALAPFCPPAVSEWGGCYALTRIDLAIVEETGRGPVANYYSTEATANTELVELPRRGGGFGDRNTAQWLAARQATYCPPPDYALEYRPAGPDGPAQVAVRLADEAIRLTGSR